MNVTHGLRRALQLNAGGIATMFGDRKRTWAELGDRVAASPARCGDGRGAGDRVAVLMLNQDRYLELYLAVAWAGAVIVPLNIRWSAGGERGCRCATAARGLLIDRCRSPQSAAGSRTASARSG